MRFERRPGGSSTSCMRVRDIDDAALYEEVNYPNKFWLKTDEGNLILFWSDMEGFPLEYVSNISESVLNRRVVKSDQSLIINNGDRN